MNCQRLITHRGSGTLALIACVLLLGGCRLIHKSNSSQEMAVELEQAPPITAQTLGDRHMLVMRAPNPGWSLRLDRDQRGKDEWIVFITIRRPDPAFMYPQRIVDKRLLTEVEISDPIRVIARLLDHNENGTNDDYAPLTLVDSLEP